MRVEVVYALPSGAEVVGVTLPEGATLREALLRSGLPVDLQRQKFGVFGCQRPLHHPLADGDRVEIYRPLAVDPKEARRRRARRTR